MLIVFSCIQPFTTTANTTHKCSRSYMLNTQYVQHACKNPQYQFLCNNHIRIISKEIKFWNTRFQMHKMNSDGVCFQIFEFPLCAAFQLEHKVGLRIRYSRVRNGKEQAEPDSYLGLHCRKRRGEYTLYAVVCMTNAMCICIFVYAYTAMAANVHMCICFGMSTMLWNVCIYMYYTHACICIYIYAYIHTYIHAYMHS